jgi:DnaJ-class molecular chaperone|tara:strand:+ start:93 stop:275 length:183 start_codon:yes stop_codon:yes gene_type:complete
MKDKICPQCKGNGFIKLLLEEGRVDIVTQCNLCNSEGEIYDKEFDDYFDNHVELKSLLKH